MTISNPRVIFETMIVFKAKRRHYFSKHAAYVCAAKELIKEHCYCERETFEEPYYSQPCYYHEGEHYPALVKRLARHLQWVDRHVLGVKP